MKKLLKSRIYVIGIIAIFVIGIALAYSFTNAEKTSVDKTEMCIEKGAKADLAMKCDDGKDEKKCDSGDEKKCDGGDEKKCGEADDDAEKCGEGKCGEGKCGDGGDAEDEEEE